MDAVYMQYAVSGTARGEERRMTGFDTFTHAVATQQIKPGARHAVPHLQNKDLQ